jgi:hypothetical protein
MIGVGSAIKDMLNAMRIDGELEGVGPFGAKVASADRTVRITLNVDKLAALAEDQLAATPTAQ